MNASAAAPFTFAAPPRLVIGWGAATDGRLAEEAARLGKRPLVVCGRSLRVNGTLETILTQLTEAGLSPTVHEGVPPEPDLDALQACMDSAENADSVIAIGGGSVLDVAKGAAALAGTGASARDYFSGQRPVPETGGRPILAAPTTAGTGSEVTWVCVLTDKQSGRKASIRGRTMMPAVALLDAHLTVSCPPKVTACSGMDAFVQAVEAYTSVGANPLTDALALPAARLASYTNVALAVDKPDDREAREALALGSLMAGMALNTSRLGLVHGLAHPIGALTGAAHGLVCGLLLLPVMRFNREAAAPRYARLAQELFHEDISYVDPLSAADALIDVVELYLRDYLEIPMRLGEIGLTEKDLDRVAREAMTSGSTKANPRPVTEADARAVAASCL